MSKSSSRRRADPWRLAILPVPIVLALGSGIQLAAHAAVEPEPTPAIAASRPTFDGDGAAVGVQRASAAGRPPRPERRRSTIRCWQEGRLIYEGGGLSPITRGVSPIEIRSADPGDSVLQVFDLKNGLCLVESPVIR